MQRIRGVVVGRERVCKDDASAQTVFESATRGWGYRRGRILRLSVGHFTREKGQSWYRCYQHDGLYRPIESIAVFVLCEGEKLQRSKVPVENVIASPSPEGIIVGRTRPRLCTCFFNRVSSLHK